MKNDFRMPILMLNFTSFITNYNETFYYLPVLKAETWPNNDLKRIAQINLKTIQEDIEIFSDRPNSCTSQKKIIFNHLYRFWKMDQPRTFQHYLIYTNTHAHTQKTFTLKHTHTQTYTHTGVCEREGERE